MAKVLVVEDEYHIQRLIKLILEKNGHKVDIAQNGEEGLQCIDSNDKYDLILLDLLMPGVDGLTVLRTLQARPQAMDTPVVILTALAQENVVLKGIELGAKDYIRKPFHPNELLDRLAKFIA